MTFRSPIYTRTYPPDTQVRNWDNSSLPLPFNPPANQQGYNQHDWPNPVQPYRQDKTYVYFTLPLLTAVVQLPLNQYKWPVPTQPVRPDCFWVQYEQLSNPFCQSDWPNPQSTQYVDRTWIVADNNILPQVSQLPLNQYNWPLPGQPNRLDYTWIVEDNNLLPQPTAASLPFNQYNWPNPTPP